MKGPKFRPMLGAYGLVARIADLYRAMPAMPAMTLNLNINGLIRGTLQVNYLLWKPLDCGCGSVG